MSQTSSKRSFKHDKKKYYNHAVLAFAFWVFTQLYHIIYIVVKSLVMNELEKKKTPSSKFLPQVPTHTNMKFWANIVAQNAGLYKISQQAHTSILLNVFSLIRGVLQVCIGAIITSLYNVYVNQVLINHWSAHNICSLRTFSRLPSLASSRLPSFIIHVTISLYVRSNVL